MEAHVTVAGNVGNLVEWKDVGPVGGRTMFSLAHTPRVRRDNGWVDGETTWYRVTCWRRLAEHVRGSVKAGQPVVVGGRLTTQRWTTQNGVERQDFEIEAQWVAHDLRLGTAEFTKMQARPPAEEPQFETPYEAERVVAEQAPAGEGAETAPDAATDTVRVDADGVITDDDVTDAHAA
ncbi:MAG: single-stranded DNA-binding protein [Propionibacteriaceae bacterium]|nr:single-stranded DNA-binding protein [Propionibacteriaceae bacterium]